MGQAVFAPWRDPRVQPRDISHLNRRVVLLCSRLTPPWFNTAVVLQGWTAVACYVPAWKRSALRTALHDAGFSVEERRTWFNVAPRCVRRISRNQSW